MNEDTGDFIYPSYWAGYLAKVAEITLLPVTYIWHRLSLACGLQYIMIWNHRQGLHCLHASSLVSKVHLDQPL